MSPIYDFQCLECNKREIDVFVHSWDDEITCKECGSKKMTKLYSGFPVPHIFPKDGIFLTNVSAKGKLFHSKKEMRKYAKDHDLELGALD